MATEPKVPNNLDAIEAEMQRTQERMAALQAAKQKALEERRDVGRPVFLAALERVKIGDLTRADAKAIAKKIEALGPARVAEILCAA